MMSTSPESPTSLVGRVLVATASLALGIFFAAIGVLILRAPQDGEPAWAGWFLRGFVLFIFGSISAGGFVFAWRAIRGDVARPVPELVRARCPGCGEPRGAGSTCDHCDLDRVSADDAWRALKGEEVGPLLFGGSMGAGIACLGLFLATWAVFGDEKRALAVIAYVGLAVLLVVVGAMMIFGFVLALRERRYQSFACDLSEGSRRVSANAEVRARAAYARGRGEVSLPVEEAPGAAHSALSPAHRALGRVVAVLHARGEASLTYHRALEWSFEPGRAPELTRNIAVDLLIDAVPPRLGVAGRAHVPVDARDRVLAALSEDGSLLATASALTLSPDLARAFEAFAARLGGDEVDAHVLSVIAAVLGASREGYAPYRA